MFGIDFSWARPSIASLKAAGVKFVCRYLNDPGGKGLTKGEYQTYVKAGISVVFIYEEDGRELLGGNAAGKRVAGNARALLKALGLGVKPVYFTVDFDANASEIHAVQAALDGAASVLGFACTGIYGSDSVIDACVGSHCRYGWQTYAWSGGRLSGKAHLYQYLNGQTIGGGSVDFCRSTKAAFGAMALLAVKPTVKTTPKPVPVAVTDWSKNMYGFVRKTSNGEVAVVNSDTGQKRPLRKPEWLSYLANGAKFAELSDKDYDSIPTVK